MKRVLQRVPFGKGAHAYTGPSSTQWRNFDNEVERETEDDDYLYRYGLFFAYHSDLKIFSAVPMMIPSR